jgi:hypothetical protein
MGANSELFIDMREQEYMINATFKVKGKAINIIENHLLENTNLISYKTVIDTDNMYKEDATFKKMVKDEKLRRKAKEDYINKNNHKYK